VFLKAIEEGGSEGYFSEQESKEFVDTLRK